MWDAAATELQVHGSRCNSGSPIVLRNADSGAVVDRSMVDNIGAWSFNTSVGDVTAVPCRVRVEVDESSGEIDVANAPSNCDGGGGSVPSITEAEWDADDEHLEVEGDGAERGQAVAVYSATSNGLLGTTRVRRNGSWKFERSDPSPVPCAVRVEIAGRSAERRVADAPDHCGADVDPVAVPGVVGRSQSDAESAIEAAGLRVGSVTEQASAALAAGIVISQNPVGGTGVESDKAVSLVVSTGRALPAADFSIERASWDADDRKLLVRGTDGPRGQGRATLLSADGRIVLGQTKVEDDGKWKFEVEKPRQAPCRILVEIGGSTAMRAVSDAPANCLQ